MSFRKDLEGLVFGDYTVIELDNIRDNDRAIWVIQCNKCKFFKKSTSSNLISGGTTKCQICKFNDKAGLTMKEIDEIEVLYFNDNITKQEIADRYNVPRSIIYGLKRRFEWNIKKKPLKRERQSRPWRNAKTNWFDSLDNTFENGVRCFVSNSDKDPRKADPLVVAYIVSKIKHDEGHETYFEFSSANEYRYAIPC